jgi:hypothetical protein
VRRRRSVQQEVGGKEGGGRPPKLGGARRRIGRGVPAEEVELACAWPPVCRRRGSPKVAPSQFAPPVAVEGGGGAGRRPPPGKREGRASRWRGRSMGKEYVADGCGEGARRRWWASWCVCRREAVPRRPAGEETAAD